ncbi:MAG TPA: glycoside hydrolase domain-containing protein [Terracidiphilus sp.]|nr:glycoside hydrolase domain-containing protein [Terracidiphilus sp.]
MLRKTPWRILSTLRTRIEAAVVILSFLLGTAPLCFAQKAYVGFDRNNYPGDEALPALHQSFRYTGYWLNNPPDESTNSWIGKRDVLKRNGFGFLVLFNGRAYVELKGQDAAAMGKADGKAAVNAAMSEGFPHNVLIFLDQEEGGRLLEEQAAYVFAWIDAVRKTGARAGVYCSDLKVQDSSGVTSTAEDIATREAAREQVGNAKHNPAKLALWIADDACPPSPGCALPPPQLDALPESVRQFATVWQYALSPRRVQFSAACPQNAAPDGNCYAPGMPRGANSFVDLDTANSPDPSEDH